MTSRLENKLLTGLLVGSLVFQNLGVVSRAQAVSEKSVPVKQVSLEQKVSVSELFRLDAMESTSRFVRNNRSGKPFKEQIKKYGIQKTIVHNVSERFYCIDLARKYVETQDSELILDKNYLSIARRLGTESKKFDGKSHVNPMSSKVLKAQSEVIKINTGYYIKLFESNLGTYSVKNVEQSANGLVKNTFSSGEYEKYHDRHCKAITKYYAALKKTLGIIEWIVGGRTLDGIRDKVLTNYENYKVGLYPELKNK